MRNCMGTALTLTIVSLIIFSTIYMLEQEEKSRIGRLERVTGKEMSLFSSDLSNMAGGEADFSYQMLVDRLLCLSNVDREGIREPRQDELTMEQAYTRCLEELERMADLGVEITEWEFGAFQLDSAELVSLYSEAYGESAWWRLHLRAQDAESGRYAKMDVQLDAMTGIICQINLEESSPFEREGTLEKTTLAYQAYLDIPQKFSGQVEIWEGVAGTIDGSVLYTLDGRLVIAMHNYLLDSEGHGFFIWVRSA